MNPMTAGAHPIYLRILRKIIRSGRRPGLGGAVGRWVGWNIGWPLYGGARLRIEDSTEAIQELALKFGAYEPNLAFIIGESLTAGDLFIDVGGNIGNHTLIAAQTGANVLTFEPLARLADRIEASLQLNGLSGRVNVLRHALGDKKGSGVLNIALRSDDGSHSLIEGVESLSMEHVSVPILPLDDVLNRLKVTPGFIKVDVEGYEARVLDGAKELLDCGCYPVWLVETADRLSDRIGETAASVVHRLTSRGYELWRVPDTGQVQKQTSPIAGELANYCAVHPKSKMRPQVLNALRKLETVS
jgi:FkbM family methyltransferase